MSSVAPLASLPVLLERGRVRVAVATAPLRVTVLRDDRPLVAGLSLWACDGTIDDRFVRVTEGVVAREHREPEDPVVEVHPVVPPPTRAPIGRDERDAEPADAHARSGGPAAPTATATDGTQQRGGGAGHTAATFAVRFASGRNGTLRLALPAPDVVTIEFTGDPGDDDAAPHLRTGFRWPVAAGTRLAGLGARHHPAVDHAGRDIQLGADRRYLGPGCAPEMAARGGIPQGDYAPIPFLQSGAGWAAWLDTAGNGTRFDLADDAVAPSVRSVSGPLRLHLLLQPGPAARLGAFARATGRPALLPAWGYGFWKSRDIHRHQDEVEEDVHGCRWHGIPVDAVVLDSPWETNYNTWRPNPHQFPDFAGMVTRLRADGVRTVVWVTPWVNVDSAGGQTPPDPASIRLHRRPAETFAEGVRVGAFIRPPAGEGAYHAAAAAPAFAAEDASAAPAGAADASAAEAGAGPDRTTGVRGRRGKDAGPRPGAEPARGDAPYVAQWWMGRGSPIDFTGPGEAWWRAQARETLALGVQGIKADDGEGYYLPEGVRFADGSDGARRAWRWGDDYRRSMRRALQDVHPGDGVLFGRSGWTGQQATGMLWAGDQASDFWSLKVMLAATVSAAHSGVSNWSHDIGGYLGDAGVRRATGELLVRWAQLGCFTPLMQAHARLEQEPWTYDHETLDHFRGAVLLHEMLVPYVRAAARSAARSGLPITRPLSLLDPGDDEGWATPDAFGYGPSLLVAPVVEEGAEERTVRLPAGDWIAAWSGERFAGRQTVTVAAPLGLVPVWVREGAIVVTHPAEHVARGLGSTSDTEAPYVATLWGTPRHGRALAHLPDGSPVRWVRGRWELPAGRDVTAVERGG